DSGSQRLTNNLQAWKYLYNQEQAEADFASQSGQGADITYPALSDQYAVLVQGSYEPKNVRHMGDVMMMYQLLRKGGFPDDHIILVVDKATATDNKYIIRADDNGPDLMGGTEGLPAAVIDYDNADLSAQDISNILLGVQTSRTPTVLPRNAGQNVLLFWSGHGGTHTFEWRKDAFFNGFTTSLMQTTAQTMLSSDAPTCRKLLVVAEPCYGESVISALDGIRGALGICGANSYEQSWGDNWSSTQGAYLCDRFSLNFYNCLNDNPATNYHDLFLYLAQHTIASHARIVNANHFGNLTTANPSEFIIYGEH
ncbi:MAG: peptidase C13, partial [Prevotella sp.]|nr:peptidase C13 [Prevotella sp.]